LVSKSLTKGKKEVKIKKPNQKAVWKNLEEFMFSKQSLT